MMFLCKMGVVTTRIQCSFTVTLSKLVIYNDLSYIVKQLGHSSKQGTSSLQTSCAAWTPQKIPFPKACLGQVRGRDQKINVQRSEAEDSGAAKSSCPFTEGRHCRAALKH